MPLVHLAKKNEKGVSNGELILKSGYFDINTDMDLSEITGETENLVFFFYGKPAYKVPRGYDPSDLPIGFIIETNENPNRIFPFDTGAYVNRRFKQILGNNYINEYNLLNYQLSTVIQNLGKYINAIWQKNKFYYNDKHRIHKIIKSSGDKYITALIKLIKAPASSFCDERKHTIEIQFNVKFELNNNIKAVVVAQAFLDRKPELIDLIKQYNAKLICYSSYGGLDADLFTESLQKEIYRYYMGKGYF